MNENAQAWVAALRSGDYKQARQALRTDEGYCCLGVACDLAAKEGLVEHTTEPDVIDGNLHRYGSPGLAFPSSGVLPLAVVQWLGVTSSDGAFTGEIAGYTTLAGLNDLAKFSFDRIADVIESEPEGLFGEAEVAA